MLVKRKKIIGRTTTRKIKRNGVREEIKGRRRKKRK